MTGIEIAALLRDYGPYGAIGLLCAVVVYLHKLVQGCQEARVSDAKINTAALERQASTNIETAAGLNAIRAGQTEILRMLALLQKEMEGSDERIRDRMSEIQRRIDTICRGGA
ncbi:hypothetical protein DK419_12985 [Methylobacterium terrae]|uniref:Uncharacterized protein n=1 Tax=Methylobacterium terrae TaxID=2202827 RepID=A0A2U8WLJ1_9HYPH|nr:hypothetical protein [Methylobacterium terrae]AWN47114.1 hypothetical protein DK419_12985 [Methylobacterium terrae]